MKRLLSTFASALASIPLTANALEVETPDITQQSVDDALLQIVNSQLPEARAVNSAFLNTDYDPYLSLNQDANVSVTFLDEGAGYKNSLGWLTFANDTFNGLNKGDIDLNSSGNISLSEISAISGVETGWLFSNVSEQGGGGSLLTGDTVQIGNEPLSANTSVSFFLAQNSANNDGSISNGILNDTRQIFYGLDFLNPESDFTSTFESSLVDSRHVAMLFADDNQEQVIMGFEDLNRVNRFSNDWNIRSDEDFNDAIFIVQSDPADAFGDSNISTAPIPALGSGLTGLLLLIGLTWVSSRKPEDQQTALSA